MKRLLPTASPSGSSAIREGRTLQVATDPASVRFAGQSGSEVVFEGSIVSAAPAFSSEEWLVKTSFEPPAGLDIDPAGAALFDRVTSLAARDDISFAEAVRRIGRSG